MSAKIYKNTVGFLIKVNMGRDITGASNYYFNVRKPSGEIVQWVPTIGATNKFYYYTQGDDFDEVGTYIIQPYLTLSAWTGPGIPVRFSVINPIF